MSFEQTAKTLASDHGLILVINRLDQAKF